MQECVLIDQYKALVELYARPQYLWKITQVEGMDQNLKLSSLGIEPALQDLYEDIIFKPKKP